MATNVQPPAPSTEPTPAPPAPQVAPPSASPTAAPSGLTEARVKELLNEALTPFTKDLKEVVGRAQSTQDRRFNRTEEELAAIKTRLDAAGGDVGRVARDMALDELIQKGQAPADATPPSPPGKSWTEEWAQHLKTVLEKHGVELTPDEYKANFGSSVNFNSQGAAYAKLSDVVIAKSKGESVTPAAAMPEGSATPPAAASDAHKLHEQYMEAVNSGAPIAKLEELHKQYQESVS